MHPQDNLLADGGLFKMFSLAPRDRLLIVAVLVVTLVGVATKHWRDARREGTGLVPPHESAAAIPSREVRTSGRAISP